MARELFILMKHLEIPYLITEKLCQTFSSLKILKNMNAMFLH